MRHQDPFPPSRQVLGFNTASGMRSHATANILAIARSTLSFNTASGMRSHATETLFTGQTKHKIVSIPQAV